jgi:thioredoxin 1
MADIAHLTTDSFETAIAGDTPVLVDFWAEWCAPCRAISPILEEIARDNTDRVNVVKLNVDEEPDVPKRLGIMGIPTVILFAKGEEKVRIVGARGKDQFLREIEPHLASARGTSLPRP